MPARAIFLDRDGTLVHAQPYPRSPDDLVLYDGIAPGLTLLLDADWRLVVITNQSGLARGYFTATDLRLMHDHLVYELKAVGVQLDGIYYCPHHPDGEVPELAFACRCRKPEPGMLLRAAAELDLDLMRSWILGDALSDIEAGHRVGCRTVLVGLNSLPLPAFPPDFVARDTAHALRIVAAVEGLGPAARARLQG